MVDSIDEAIYRTVHDYPGKVPRLAPLLGMRPGTLNNKADPGMDHQLTLRESIALQLHTQDRRIAQAYCQELDGAFVALPGDVVDASDSALLDLWMNLQVELGKSAETIREALADGVITRDEMDTIRAQVQRDIMAQLQLLQRLESLKQVDKPAGEGKG